MLERNISFDRIVAVVEAMRGIRWEQFCDKHGDEGRDMVLYLARKRSGMTLREIGKCAGGLDYKTIGKATERFCHLLKTDAVLHARTNKCLRQMSLVDSADHYSSDFLDSGFFDRL